MFIFDIDRWVEIWVTITRNKTRSLLTGFGGLLAAMDRRYRVKVKSRVREALGMQGAAV